MNKLDRSNSRKASGPWQDICFKNGEVFDEVIHGFTDREDRHSESLAGDSDISQLKELQDADIILTTPEKFDSLTRKRKDSGGMSFFGDIALVLIDEVHLLNESRGAALEAIVSRLKMLAR